jgi:hypothetical protein
MTFGKWMSALLAVSAALCAGAPAGAQITGKMVNPDVLLVLDTSRSMDWLPEYKDSAGKIYTVSERERLAAAQCLAADAVTNSSARTSWQQLLDVMLGSIAPGDFHCFLETSAMRPALQSTTLSSNVTGNTSEYRTSPSPHFRAISCTENDPRDPSDRGNWNDTYGQCIGKTLTGYMPVDGGRHMCRVADVQGDRCFNYNPLANTRSANGILERYRTLARFGVMTYDNKPSPLSNSASVPGEDPAHIGLFDYGDSRKWNCKHWSGVEDEPGAGCTWNAGTRATNANAVGRMVSISDDLEMSNQAIRDVLNTTEPLYCSPVGALLDDVGYFFNTETSVKPALAGSGGGTDLYYACRPKIVVLISDGAPNQDFEFPQDYCDSLGTTNPAPSEPGATPAANPYSCPWNSSKQEITELRTLMTTALAAITTTPTMDPIYFVVIGFNSGKKGEVTCTPTWTGTACVAPVDTRCIQIKDEPANATECNAAFVTPRQFLNAAALEGWPTTYTLQPPWRDDPTGVSNTSDICSDVAPLVDSSCGGETGDGQPNGAIFVDGPEELSAVLDLILSSVTASTATRTEVVTTNQVSIDYGEDWADFVDENADDKAIAQYEFDSGFEVLGGLPWRGFLYRQGRSCSDSEADSDSETDTQSATDTGGQGEANDSFDALLDDQSVRNIYSVNSTGLAEAFAGYGTADAFLKGQDVLDELGVSTDIDDCDIGGPTADGVCDGKFSIMSVFKKHLYGEGDSARKEHRLADIYNATPALLGPPLERLTVASYQAFQSDKSFMPVGSATTLKQQSERPPVLFAGTNDGVLHAFDVWATDTSTSVENWGFVPNALLADATRQFPITWTVETDSDGKAVDYTVAESGLYQHTFGVDGSPVAADVRLYKDGGAGEADHWRSIVLGGLGKGGVGYYALDVTEKQGKPSFRWEISKNSNAYNEAGTFGTGADFEFGMAVSKPALTYVYVDKASLSKAIPGSTGTSSAIELGVAILPGGYKSDETGGPGATTGVAIVRAADGNLVRYLSPSVQADLCTSTAALWGSSSLPDHYLDAQLIGEPAVPYPLRSLTVNDEAFIGDDRGRLWRIDMTSKYPNGNPATPGDTGWCLDLFFDSMLTTDFPYKDCLASPACCAAKTTDVTAACTDGEIAAFTADGAWGTDACTGQKCTDPDYPFPRIPVVNAPTIVQDEDRNNIILFGTGQIDGVETLDHHRVFSLTQSISYRVTGTGSNKKAATQSAYMSGVKINWWLGEPIPTDVTVPTGLQALHNTNLANSRISLTPDSTVFGGLFSLGEKLLGRIAVFNEVAYFVTFIPAVVGNTGPVDACQSGGSRIWGVSFASMPTGASAWTNLSFGKVDGAGTMFTEYRGDLLSGVKVVRRPSCNGQADFQLVSQRANPAVTTPSTTTASAEPRVVPVALSLHQPTRGFTTVAIDSWSLVFD